MSRKVRPLAALAMLAVIVAGCSNAPAETGTGSSGGNNAAATHEKAVRFAECMRDNSVGAFPDPDASGDLSLDAVVNGSSIDTSSAAWKRAISACKALQPSGFAGTTATPKQMTERLRFAQCIRDNGVPDFPDPTKDSPMVDTNRIPSAATESGMSALNAAMRKCGDIIVNQLTPPS